MLKGSKFNVSYSYINQEKEQEAHIVSQYALEYLRHKLIANALIPIADKLKLSLNYRWQDRVGQYTDFDGSVQDYKPFGLLDARLTWSPQP